MFKVIILSFSLQKFTKFIGAYTSISAIALVLDTFVLISFQGEIELPLLSVISYLIGACFAFTLLKLFAGISVKKALKSKPVAQFIVFTFSGAAGLVSTYLVFTIQANYLTNADVLITKGFAVLVSYITTLCLRLGVLFSLK